MAADLKIKVNEQNRTHMYGAIVQRLNEGSTGAGAAIANAFFDATGMCMSQFPLTPARFGAALKRPA